MNFEINSNYHKIKDRNKIGALPLPCPGTGLPISIGGAFGAAAMEPWHRGPYAGGRDLGHTPAADAATRERMREREESSGA
jgi:hypothetical protein